MEHEFLIAWVKAVFTTIGIGVLILLSNKKRCVAQ